MVKQNIEKTNEMRKIKTGVKVGDVVRVRLDKGTFKKGYTESWSRETYKVKQVNVVTVILDNDKRYRIDDVQVVDEEFIEIDPLPDKVVVARKKKKAKMDFDREGLSMETIITKKRKRNSRL